MGNQQSQGKAYPLCQSDCQDQRLAQGHKHKMKDEEDKQQKECVDDYFGRVVIITRKVLKNSLNMSSNSNQIDYPLENDSKLVDNVETNSSSIILEKVFMDQIQLNQALNQARIFQGINHPNIVAIQSIQSNVITNTKEGKLYIGRVYCDYYPQNLNYILKQRKEIVSSLKEKEKSTSSLNTQRQQSSTSIKNGTSIRNQNSNTKQSSTAQNTPQALTPRTDRNSFITAFTEKEVWYMLDALVDGLKLFQEKEIIHGDLRPQTIYLTEQGYIKLSIIQCFAKDYSHTNFHVAASHILKGKSLQQKIFDENLLLSLEQLVQLKRLNNSNSARQQQQSANLVKEILSKQEFNPYKSQVFSLGILLLQVIFCGSVQCCQPVNSGNSNQNTSRKNTNSSQSQLTNRRSSFSQSSNQNYLYIINEKTKDISINFQLIFDLLIFVKTKFSPSLFKILNLCLEINEKNRVDCIQLYSELHSLDLQTEVSLTMDESVVVRQPLQVEYQQGIANPIRNPSYDQYLLQKSNQQMPKNKINSINPIKLLPNKISGNLAMISPLNKDIKPQITNFLLASPVQNNKQETSLKKFNNLSNQNEQLTDNSMKAYNPNQFFNVSSLQKKTQLEKKQPHHMKNVSIDIMQNTSYRPTVTAATTTATNGQHTLTTLQNNNYFNNEFSIAKGDFENKIEPVQKGITLLGQVNDPVSSRMTDIINTNSSNLMKENFKRYSVPSVLLNIADNKQDKQFSELEQVKRSRKGGEGAPYYGINDKSSNTSQTLQNNSFKNVGVTQISESIPYRDIITNNDKQINNSFNQSFNYNNSSFNQNQTYNQMFTSNIHNTDNQSCRRVSNMSEQLAQVGQKDYFSLNSQKENISTTNYKDQMQTSTWSNTGRESNNFISQNQTFATNRKQSDSSSTANHSLSTNFQFYHPQTNYLNSIIQKNDLSSPNSIQQRVSSMHVTSSNNEYLNANESGFKGKNSSALNILDKSSGYTPIQNYASQPINNDYYNFASPKDQSKEGMLNEKNSFEGIRLLLSPSSNKSIQISTAQPNGYNLNNNSNQQNNNSTNLNQLKNMLISQPLQYSDKSNISSTNFQSSYLYNKPNTSTVDNSESFKYSSWNFKIDNNSQQQHQPFFSPLTSPKDINGIIGKGGQISDFNFQSSQFIQQSIDLTNSQQQQLVNPYNLNSNTYTFSSPQRGDQQYSPAADKLKYPQPNAIEKCSNEHPLQQTAKFISESSRHQFSSSLYERFPIQDSLKEEEEMKHIYGSPKKVIISSTNIPSPRSHTNTANTQRNKSMDNNSSYNYLKQFNSSPQDEQSEKQLHSRNNSQALIIFSPNRPSLNNQSTTTATFNVEKSYLNSLVNNTGPNTSSKGYLNQYPVSKNSNVNINEFNSQINKNKQGQYNNVNKYDQTDNISNNEQSNVSNDHIEIKEWNDIESEMSDTLQQSTSEGVFINQTVGNDVKGISPILQLQNQINNKQIQLPQQYQKNFQKNPSEIKQVLNISNQNQILQTNSSQNKNNLNQKISQSNNNNNNNNNNNDYNINSIYQIKNIQNIQNVNQNIQNLPSNLSNKASINSSQQQSSKTQIQNKISMHRKNYSLNGQESNGQVSTHQRNQSQSIHMYSPKEIRDLYDYKIKHPSNHVVNNHTQSDIQINTSGNTSILLLNNQKQQNYNTQNNKNEQTTQLSSTFSNAKVIPSLQHMTTRNISNKEITNQTLNSTKMSSTRVLANQTENSFCAPYANFDGAKKIALLTNYDADALTQKQLNNNNNVSNNSSIQSQAKLNFMLSPTNIPAQYPTSSQFKYAQNNKILKELAHLQKAPFQLNLKQQIPNKEIALDIPSTSKLSQNISPQQQKSLQFNQPIKYMQDSFLSKNSIL